MSSVNSWQSRTAALMALAIATSATAPIVKPAPASAQLFPQQQLPQQRSQPTQFTIPRGTSIPVRYDKAEKIVVTPTETVPLTLTVATDVVNRRGTVLISAGSQIVGELQPVTGGSQFVASELVTPGGRRQSIDATSSVISKTQEVRRGANAGSILTGAAVGSAAAAGISGIAGDRKINLGKVLIGTGAGAAGGLLLGRNKVDVIVIDPNTDLNITLNSSLPVAYSY